MTCLAGPMHLTLMSKDKVCQHTKYNSFFRYITEWYSAASSGFSDGN